MKDRSVEFPNRYRLKKVAGTDDIFDLVPAPGDVTEEGTYINKATLLKDTTAALYGLDGDAVLDDVLNVLGRLNGRLGNEYVWAKSDSSGVVGYVNSPDPSAYPVDDGYTYTALGQLGRNMTKIATGSYTGTGTYGERNPNSLTFDFAPMVVFVSAPSVTYSTTGSVCLPWVRGQRCVYARYDSSNSLFAGEMTSVEWGENGLAWVGIGKEGQLNKSGTVYEYLAIG